ncbi:MAG: branched-chain amino acid ABC transporter permease [Firmicutes bacterium]|jgi:branched-chain amino acid transport system permease protein|nr:branched-chain amino acid ABC transporter permease [Bacillota bacterium]
MKWVFQINEISLGPGIARTYALAGLGVLLVIYPLVVNDYWAMVGNFYGIYVLLGCSLNLIVGDAGLFNLGHAAFYAVGAYSTAILNTRWHVPTLVLLPLSAALAAMFAVVISKPILHLRGDYLCIVTIGFGEIVRIALYQNPFGLTGGPNGIFGIGRPSLFGFVFRRPWHYFYLIWAFVVLTIFAMRRLEESRLGRAWNCIREDDLAAEAMGIDTARLKLLAFALGAGVAGIAGNLFASNMTVIAPESFSFWESVLMFCIVVLGGPGSVPGVIIGAFGMFVLPELFRGFFLRSRLLVFGAAMVAMMLFRPEGLLPVQQWKRAAESRGEGARRAAAV